MEPADFQAFTKTSIFRHFRTKILSTLRKQPFLGVKIRNYLDNSPSSQFNRPPMMILKNLCFKSR